MEIKICKVNPDARIPEYKTTEAACFDLEAVESVTVAPNEIKLVPTGLVFEIPDRYFLCIAPRSSLAKTGLVMPHSFGILDPDYSGPNDVANILVKNVTDKPVVIEKYQRIAQGTVLPAPKIKFQEITVDELKQESRGGFGSTGKK